MMLLKHISEDEFVFQVACKQAYRWYTAHFIAFWGRADFGGRADLPTPFGRREKIHAWVDTFLDIYLQN